MLSSSYQDNVIISLSYQDNVIISLSYQDNVKPPQKKFPKTIRPYGAMRQLNIFPSFEPNLVRQDFQLWKEN
jgi:hypothetical protein